ncbi:hypothetical protein [uncultured Megasphaera sp.]|uniref:hypothetical protein n=1 Tax=uncultured Megasphaera sp. TaxID=165188 RepID=UPI0037833D58
MRRWIKSVLTVLVDIGLVLWVAVLAIWKGASLCPKAFLFFLAVIGMALLFR